MTLQRREIDIGIGDETSSVPFFSDIEWSRNNVGSLQCYIFRPSSDCHGREIEEKAFELICDILRTHQYVEFLVGRDGDFDLMMASVIRKAKKHVGSENSSMIWVLPYLTADFQKNENEYYQYYDDIEVCEESAAAHPKSAFKIRNRSMIDRADMAVFYMEHESGGTYDAWKYAKESDKKIVNLV